MGKFRLEVTENAKRHIEKHLKSGNKANIKKIEILLVELENHPFTGSGQPEELKFSLQGFWSRRINKKDRMIYQVKESIVTVEVVSAMGHYFDK
jgi:toxin YoeB